jgi:GNAT superfamily N-acetyltransferase
MTSTIRFATEADLDCIHGFVLALAEYEKLLPEVRADRDTLRRHLFGERPMAETLLAELDGKPVGFALFFHNFSTFEGRPGIYLEDLFVLPEARGKGLARGMLAELARLTIERDCARLEWAVLDWNTPAINFYRSIGARPMDEWTIQRVDGEALIALARPAAQAAATPSN